MKKFVCSICGYGAEGAAPDKCPQCNATKDKFIEQSSEGLAFADEHRIGIAKGVDPDIIEGLRNNFMGECTEVGMYLAMSRQADREGFPEVAEAYKRIAFEEAEHAAKFAELLGEVVETSTKKNLELRVAAEHGATQGKLTSRQKQSSSILTQSMTPCMRWRKMKHATVWRFRACSNGFSNAGTTCKAGCGEPMSCVFITMAKAEAA